MKHLFNLNKYFIYIGLCLFFCCQDNLTDPIDCADYDLFEDECGQCTQCDESCDCDLEECDWNLSKDSCDICFGNDTSCSGCMNDLATNFDSDATIPCNNCCVYSNIFIVYSDNNGFDPSLHQTSINVPIYWLNNSDHEIIIKTVDSPQPSCAQDQESIYTNNDCYSYNSLEQCENINQGCTWYVPDSYNQNWDDFEITVPAGTGLTSPTQFYFIGFSYPSGYQYYYDLDNENTQYGFINVNQN